jgi:hypothetical protein
MSFTAIMDDNYSKANKILSTSKLKHLPPHKTEQMLFSNYTL